MHICVGLSGYYGDDYILSDIKAFKQFKKSQKLNDLKLLIEFSRNDLTRPIDELDTMINKYINFYLHNGMSINDIAVSFQNNQYKKTFTKDELNKIAFIEKECKKLGITFGVFDQNDLYSVKEVENASNKINKIARYIKSLNLSPLEKILLCTMIVSKNSFAEVENNESSSLARSVFSILNDSKRLVCTGYAALVKSIMDTVNDSNIQVFRNEVAIYHEDTKKYGRHENNTVYLKDEKYGIDGFYYLDSCWSHDEKTKFKLNYTLLSMDEIKDIGIIKDQEKKGDKSAPPIENNRPQAYYLFDKFNPYHTHSFVSENDAKLIHGFRDIENCDETLLSDCLCSRQDFKDFLVLKQIERENKEIEKIYKKVNKNPSSLKVYGDSKAIFEYLKEHSEHIDFDKIQSALYRIIPYFDNTISKQEAYKKAKDIINNSIDSAKDIYSDNATNELKIMSDNLEK